MQKVSENLKSISSYLINISNSKQIVIIITTTTIFNLEEKQTCGCAKCGTK
jgi:hypothetical protein